MYRFFPHSLIDVCELKLAGKNRNAVICLRSPVSCLAAPVRRPQFAFINAILEVCAMPKDVSSPATVVSVKRLVLELEADSTSFITLRVKPDRRQSRETVSMARERRGAIRSSARGNEDLG